jgi:NMT1/THI5 like
MVMGRWLRHALAGLLAGAAVAITPAKAETVTVGLVGAISSTHWPIYIGLTKGYFAAEDVKLDLVFIQSSAALVQQLTAGSIDLALSTGACGSDPRHRQGSTHRHRTHRDTGAALCAAGQTRDQALAGSQGQDHLDRRPEGHHAHLPRADGGSERAQGRRL